MLVLLSEAIINSGGTLSLLSFPYSSIYHFLLQTNRCLKLLAYIYLCSSRSSKERERERKKKETPSFGLHSLDLHNSQALRKIETINGESSIIMKTTPGSRYPLFHNHNKYYTPPFSSLLKSVFFEANSSSSIIPNRKSNLSLSLSLYYSEKKRAVAEEQSQLS